MPRRERRRGVCQLYLVDLQTVFQSLKFGTVTPRPERPVVVVLCKGGPGFDATMNRFSYVTKKKQKENHLRLVCVLMVKPLVLVLRYWR